ncbi:MAG: radical SAM protein [Deltaproteobacteria bacterium]|nr:radical SAM protein [Deltaproteobacteria bacterium]
MLKQVHFLLTYLCNFECDHCFLFCSPHSSGTFTLTQVKQALDQAQEVGSVEWVYFEGGEPLLFFPLLVESIKASHQRGFKVGIVTNAYQSTSVEDSALWLKPLMDAGIDYLSISDDAFHSDQELSPAKMALEAAQGLGMGTGAICINQPTIMPPGQGQEKGAPVIGGGAMFRGRAVEKLTKGLALRDWQELASCPHEDLADPGRVHIDPMGNVHLCQGLTMGNMCQTPLKVLAQGYRPQEHPVCGPLLSGGPAQLISEYQLPHEAAYVDECHLCFLARKALLQRFAQYLGPPQVYGL